MAASAAQVRTLETSLRSDESWAPGGSHDDIKCRTAKIQPTWPVAGPKPLPTPMPQTHCWELACHHYGQSELWLWVNNLKDVPGFKFSPFLD